MNTVTNVPPGFRFHPTDEELIDYYLRKKIASKRIDLDVIKDVDLYKIEPWDLQELCKMGDENQNDWYFFSHKDKKYPRSSRSNRATKEGFWKATGRDKPIYSRNYELIGMRKTLVFYKGRAPNGLNSDWIMHEYRLQSTQYGNPQEEGWVVCRVFKKRIITTQKVACDYESPNYNRYDDQPSFFMQPLVIDSPTKRLSISVPSSSSSHYHHPQTGCPDCASPSSRLNHGDKTDKQSMCVGKNDGGVEKSQMMDWRAMDKYVASQLSIDQTNEANYCGANGLFRTVPEDNNYASE